MRGIPSESRFYAYVLLSIITQIFISCSTPLPYYIPIERQKKNVYYIPSTSNAPLLNNKNDLSITGSFSPGANHGITEAQVAFAPLENMGIMASTTFDFNTVDIKTGTTQVAFGIGYMKRLANNWKFETYGGYGGGKIINEHETGTSRMDLREFFIQPTIALTNNSNTLQAAFISKFNVTHFKLTDTTFENDRERFSANQIKLLVDNPNQLFWQPGVSLKAVGGNFGVNLNYTTSANLSNINFARDNGHATIGVSFRLNAGKSNNR